ncbi:hypothetical protein [Aeoliella sp.]|uniref:hypothetical protein n=1 Tax=Aeoliella sp. TaxID=2795800 RepID=UPI003CCBF31F
MQSTFTNKFRMMMKHCLRIMVGCAVNYTTQLKNVVRFTDWAESLAEADRQGLLQANELSVLERVYEELQKLDDMEEVIYADRHSRMATDACSGAESTRSNGGQRL